MIRDSLYLESSVWSCHFNDHVPQMRAQTQDFFRELESEAVVRAFVSEVVLGELKRAPEERWLSLSRLLARVNPIELRLDQAAADLADAYIRHGILTRKWLLDASHVAIATVAELDAVVSWNYRHLVNENRREAFNAVNTLLGYRPISIISPPEVFHGR